CDVLFPSVGARSRSAARAGRIRQDAFQALPEPRSYRGAAVAPPRRFPLGSRRSGLSRRSAVMDGETLAVARAAAAAATLSARDYRPEGRARWDHYVERSAAATFFHRSGWRDILEEEFGHRTHYLVAERGPAIVGV